MVRRTPLDHRQRDAPPQRHVPAHSLRRMPVGGVAGGHTAKRQAVLHCLTLGAGTEHIPHRAFHAVEPKPPAQTQPARSPRAGQHPAVRPPQARASRNTATPSHPRLAQRHKRCSATPRPPLSLRRGRRQLRQAALPSRSRRKPNYATRAHHHEASRRKRRSLPRHSSDATVPSWSTWKRWSRWTATSKDIACAWRGAKTKFPYPAPMPKS